MNYFIRLADSGCRNWRVWELRAVVLLLAGYATRDVAYGAVRALYRRREVRSAKNLLREWGGSKTLLHWEQCIREAHAGPNDRALIQKAIAHRDAMIARRERAFWASHPGFIQPEVDHRARASESGSAARGRKVRFAV